jgi:Uma2 family endonuclease
MSNYLGSAIGVITQTNPPNIPDATKTRFTPDEYPAIDETVEECHEYCNGEIIPISGDSPPHNRRAVDITTFLNVALQETNYQTYNEDLRRC